MVAVPETVDPLHCKCTAYTVTEQREDSSVKTCTVSSKASSVVCDTESRFQYLQRTIKNCLEVCVCMCVCVCGGGGIGVIS